jgi:hypothetical protein
MASSGLKASEWTPRELRHSSSRCSPARASRTRQQIGTQPATVVSSELSDHGHPADLAAECLSHTSMRPVADRSAQPLNFALLTSMPDLNCGPRIGWQTTTGFGGPGSRRCSPVKGRPDKRSVKPGASGTRHARVQAKARKASSPSEARIGPPPAAYRPYGTLCSGCVRAARVVVETAHCRLVTRERMAVLCRGSND